MSSRTRSEKGPSLQSQAVESSIEHTSIGRVVIPPGVPRGFRVFYTTSDFDGRIDERIRDFVRPATISSCHQVHGAKVCRAPVNESECDALWSDQKNSALVIKTADCLPVSIIDPKNSVIANIHSGWRSTVQNITAATLTAMLFDPAASSAFLGPTIRACCFEVGEEVAAQFDAKVVDRTVGPKPHVDIAAFTTAVLRSHGIQNIVDTGLCTRCDGSIFHSYRRDKRTGRNL
ncbi:MAG TPA: polyphenol oxidase family protein, partial [Thermoanaerobaculia bacterium]